jgi:RNA polymerase sigma-54 factor
MAISQKLHTKLVQKLILTPSLQQAIKLLPMSTLELADLLNQEMVENPMLEEVPTEDLQPVEAQPEKPEAEPTPEKTDTWDDSDYEYFFGDYLDDGYRPRTHGIVTGEGLETIDRENRCGRYQLLQGAWHSQSAARSL